MVSSSWNKVEDWSTLPKGITGIYRLTNPEGKMYIGQAEDIKIRWIKYSRRSCKRQKKLYNALIKHMNFDKWTFEYFECSKEELNMQEYYWINMYSTIERGLNIKKGAKNELE